MKYIFSWFLIVMSLHASVIESPLLSIDKEQKIATIHVDKINLGMSGFVYHVLTPKHSSILKNAVVTQFNKETKIATLQLSDYDGLRNNSLPRGKWTLKVGDIALFAFGYNRSVLIAPSEEIYHQITKSVRTQWIHPDIFATILSFRGHPTPLKSDFDAMSVATSVGLLFIYLDKKVYMLDIKSFKILSISDAPLVQDSVQLPFYSRVDKIDANWFGEGSDELKAYEPHYYELLVKYNKKNKELHDTIAKGDAKYHYLLKKFELGN